MTVLPEECWSKCVSNTAHSSGRTYHPKNNPIHSSVDLLIGRSTNSMPRSTVTGFCASPETQPVKINVIDWIEGTNPLERKQPFRFSSSPAKLLRARQQCDERVLLTF
jgi:hypothetical protein